MVRNGPILRVALYASDAGNTLFLKLCGFIQDQQARFLDVGEHHYRLRIGFSRIERFWHGLDSHDPVEVTLQVRRGVAPDSARTSRAARAVVEITVRPASRRWRRDAFERCARQIVQRLRRHLIAS